MHTSCEVRNFAMRKLSDTGACLRITTHLRSGTVWQNDQ